MKQNDFQSLQLSLSGLSSWLILLAVIWLLGSIGLGWLVKSIAILFVLILLAPVVAFLVFRWWLQRNLTTGNCPVCSYELAGINGMQLNCPSCGEPLSVADGKFQRLAPPGTVDVEVVDVDVDVVDVQPRQLEDG